MSSSGNNLYTISFTVGAESGIALVAAPNERQAMDLLRNSGNHSHDEPGYSLVEMRNIGLTASCTYGLLMESYVNAQEAYKAILDAANKLVGPQGAKGDQGEKGDKGDPALFGSVGAYVDNSVGVPSVRVIYTGPDNLRDVFFDFHNLKGETGEQGPEGPPVPVIDNLNTDARYVALAASQGVELKNRINAVNNRVDGVAFLGDVVESVL